MPEIRITDEQGNTHIFPDGSTAEQIAQVMKVKPPSPPATTPSGVVIPSDVAQASNAPQRSGFKSWLQDYQRDINEGGGRTIVGRLLGRMQGRGDQGYAGAQAGGGGKAAGFFSGPMTGPAEAVEGTIDAADIGHRDFQSTFGSGDVQRPGLQERSRAANKIIGGVAKTAAPAAALVAPEILPTMVPAMATGGATQSLTSKAAQAFGVDPDTADLLGNVATVAAPAAMRGGGRLVSRNAPGISRAVTQTVPLATAAEELYNGRPMSALHSAAWGTYFAPRLARMLAPAVRGAGNLAANAGEVMAPWRMMKAPGAPTSATNPDNANPIFSSGERQPFPAEGEYVNTPPKRLPPDMTMPNQGPTEAPGGFEGPSAPPALPSARGRKLSTVTSATRDLATSRPFPPEGDTPLYHGTPMGNLPKIGEEGLQSGVGRNQAYLTRSPGVADYFSAETRPGMEPGVTLETSVPESAIQPTEAHPESIRQPGVYGHEGEFQSVTTPSTIPPDRMRVRNVTFPNPKQLEAGRPSLAEQVKAQPEPQWPAEYQGAPQTLDASGGGGANYSAEDLAKFKAAHGIGQPEEARLGPDSRDIPPDTVVEKAAWMHEGMRDAHRVGGQLLRPDEITPTEAEPNVERVDEYAKLPAATAPPINVGHIEEGGKTYNAVLDGHHRLAAAIRRGDEFVPTTRWANPDYPAPHGAAEVQSNQSLLDKMRADLDQHGQFAEETGRKLFFMNNKSGYQPVLPTGEGGYQVGPDEFVGISGQPSPSPQTLLDRIRRKPPQ